MMKTGWAHENVTRLALFSHDLNSSFSKNGIYWGDSASQNHPAFTLAGVAQWAEHWPANQGVAGSIPSQSTCLGCRPGPWWGESKKQPHTDVSLPLPSLSSPVSKNKYIKSLKTF